MDRQRRYKKKGLVFTSAENSRALRAVDSRVGRKAKRDALLDKKRMDVLSLKEGKEPRARTRSVLADVNDVVPKKSEKELGLQRYKELLKWKDDRKKKMQVEKRHRKPSFRTGIFQPDQPRFLLSEDGDLKGQDSIIVTPSKPAPFKYLHRSSTKYGYTPGASEKKIPRFCTGVTPGTSMPRVPKFNLRTTPNQSLGRAAILKRNVTQKENLLNNISIQKDEGRRAQLKGKSVHNKDMKRILRSRRLKRAGPLDDSEDLGVKALPATPVVIRGRKIYTGEVEPQVTADDSGFKAVSSFAPENFNFNFAVKVNDDVQEAQVVENTELEKNVDMFRNSRVDHCLDICNTATTEDVSNVERKNVEEAFNQDENTLEHDVEEIEQESGVITSNRTEQEQLDTYENEENIAISENEVVNESLYVNCDISEEKESESNDQKLDTIMNQSTSRSPLKDHDSKVEHSRGDNSLLDLQGTTSEDSCNAIGIKTPVPCNTSVMKTPMSTRRSQSRRSARLSGCLECTLTPLMARLRPRTPCSRSTRRSLSAHTDMPMDTMFTPSSRKSSRRSVRKSSARKFTQNELVEPIPSYSIEGPKEIHSLVDHEILEDKGSAEESQVIMEEDEDEKHVGSPKNNLGTPIENKTKQTPHVENLSTPVDTKGNVSTPNSSGKRLRISWFVKESPYIDRQNRSDKKRKSRGVPEDILSLFDDVPTDGSPLPAHLTPLLIRNQRDDDQNCSDLLDLLKPTITPTRSETPDVDVWGEESPEKLSGEVEKCDGSVGPINKTSTEDSFSPTLLALPVTRRKSSRISLLPGMNDSPVEAGKLSIVPEDLISWETPMLPRIKPTELVVATPTRRSRRLSKAVPE